MNIIIRNTNSNLANLSLMCVSVYKSPVYVFFGTEVQPDVVESSKHSGLTYRHLT